METENRDISLETMRAAVVNGIKRAHVPLIAEMDQQKVGELTFLAVPNIPEEYVGIYLQTAFVNKEWRGKGVFRALFNQAVAKSKELFPEVERV